MTGNNTATTLPSSQPRINCPVELVRSPTYSHQQPGVVVVQHRDYISRSQIQSACSSNSSLNSGTSRCTTRSLPLAFHQTTMYPVRLCTREPHKKTKLVASMRDIMLDKKTLGQRFQKANEEKLPKLLQPNLSKRGDEREPNLQAPTRLLSMERKSPSRAESVPETIKEHGSLAPSAFIRPAFRAPKKLKMPPSNFKGFQTPRTANFLAQEERTWKLVEQSEENRLEESFSSIHTYRWKLDDDLQAWLKDVRNRNTVMRRQQEKAEAKWDKRVHMRVFHQREEDMKRRQIQDRELLKRHEVELAFLHDAQHDEGKQERNLERVAFATGSLDGGDQTIEEETLPIAEEVEDLTLPFFVGNPKQVIQKKELQWQETEKLSKPIPRIEAANIWIGPGRFVTQHHVSNR